MTTATKHYLVTNDFVDKQTGRDVTAGAVIEADEERAAALRSADVIGKDLTKAEIEAAKKAAEGE